MTIATDQMNQQKDGPRKPVLLEPDLDQIEQFVDAVFRHCWKLDGFISLRGFTHDNKPVLIEGVPVTAGFKFVCDAAEDKARRAANEVHKVVFCPPLVLLNNKARAREQDLLAGPVLSVECDRQPQEARKRLEQVLGQATVIVQSGGEWQAPDGELQKKLHLHWRLAAPAHGDNLAKLKLAREIATQLVGGDTSNVPLVHPLRWPGSWHRKGDPVLCQIAAINPDAEIDLDAALTSLTAARPEEKPKSNGHDSGNGHSRKERVDWAAMVQNILDGKDLHESTLRLAASYIGSGMDYDQVLRQLQALMLASRVPHDERWKSRFDNLGRLIRDGVEKFGNKNTASNEAETTKQKSADREKSLSLEDFYCYMAMPNAYIFRPTREIWPASSVNARIAPIPTGKDDEEITASRWLGCNRPVEQLTWAPGLPELIEGRIISDGGWINRADSDCYNQYRGPVIELGNAAEAGRWLEHIKKVFPDDVDHLVKWFAHRVQKPGDKINHALVLGGLQGIGKDTILEPVKRAIGPWNWAEVSPQAIQRRFNAYLKSVVLRISEARDLGDINRYQFYDHMKSYTAAPPDVLRVDEKHIREHSVLNCTGIIITTNHKSDGIFLPQDDRRHYVVWSERSRADFSEGYWRELWSWYNNGGFGHVAAYLKEFDLSSFDPKEPPPKTDAFWAIVHANQAPEEAELMDVIDRLGNPDALTPTQLQARADLELQLWLGDRKNRRALPHRLESCGYSAVPNGDAKDQLWKVLGSRQTVYAKSTMSVRDRIAAVRRLCGEG